MRYVVALVAAFVAAPALAAPLVVDSSNTPFTVAADASYDSLTVASGATLIVNATLTITGDAVIQTGGTVTHDVKPLALSRIQAGGTFEVQTGAFVDLNTKGYGAGGNGGGSAFGAAGETLNPLTLQTVAGATDYNGASHGGLGGGVAPVIYGAQVEPATFGGGGGRGSCNSRGGRGAGRIVLQGATVRINGVVRADGEAAAAGGCGNAGGGGAGGSLWIEAGTFAGSGAITAQGGNGYGGGAGGRVYVRYSGSNTFSGAIAAFAGSGGSAEAGTSYLVDASNALVAHGGNIFLEAAASHPSVTLRSGGTVTVRGASTITQPITVAAGTTLILAASDALANLTVNGAVTGTLAVRAPIAFPSTITLAGTLVADDALAVTGDLTVNAGAVVTHTAKDGGARLDVTGTLRVNSAGLIDLNGRGLPAGMFLDPATLLESATPDYVGASHGGRGGNGAQVYDSARDPALLGSGGGRGSCGSSGGGGGGAIAITAATMVVDGFVRADGGAAAAGGCGASGGGGAGGTIRAQVGTLSGSGLISAKGGFGNAGGGGGRIALYYTTKTYSGVVSALAASTAVPAQDGTVWMEQASGDLTAEGGVLDLQGGDSFPSVTLRSFGTLALNGPAAVTAGVDVRAGATVRLNDSAALTGVTLLPTIAGALEVHAPITSPGHSVSGTLVVNEALTVLGDLTVLAGGNVTHATQDDGFDLDVSGTVDVRLGATIDVDGDGFRPGPVAGFGDNGATFSPVTLQVVSGSTPQCGGSHGGRGAGAGAALAFDDADLPDLFGGGGGEGTCNSLGGSGGGRVSIRAATMIVNGFVTADGGDAPAGGCGAAGGGGAGGAIRIDAPTLSGTGIITANGGSGGGGGGGGRIRIDVDTDNFAGLLLAAAGSGGAAEAGTINVVDAGDNTLVVEGGVYPIDEGDTFDSVVLGPQGVLDIRGAALVLTPIQIPAGTSVVLSDPSALDRLSLDPSIAGTLQVDAVSTLAEDLVVTGVLRVNSRLTVASVELRASALLEHSPQVEAMDLVVTGMLDVKVGARVDVAGRGLLPGPIAGFGDNGATWSPVTLQIVSGSGIGNGGSHVTLGGQNNAGAVVAPAFDTLATPVHGGGGGGEGTCNSVGGYGGGLVRIAAGTLQLNGILTADGTAAAAGGCGAAGGGGAGGSVVLSLGSWSGTGSLLARGGSGRSGGAGGVVNITYASKTFSGPFDISGGTGTTAGSAGVSSEVVATDPPSIVSTPPVASAQVGRLFRYRALATGSGTLSWSLPQGPVGAVVDGISGELTWTPPAPGTATFRLRVDNALGFDEQTFVLDPTAPPFITSTPTTTGRAGDAYHYDADDRVEATGTGPLTFSAAVAPVELAVDAATGVVSWTPSTPGTVPVCLRADSPYGANQQCFQVTVTPAVGATPPTITSTPAPDAYVGVPWAYDDDATAEASGDAPISWTALLAPAGFGIDPSTGAVAWTPAAAGDAGVCLVASNAAGEDTQCFTVAVSLAGPPVFTSRPITLATQGQPYAYDLDSTVSVSGAGPVTFGAPTAPAGFAVDVASGLVTWMPDAPGNFDVVIAATNAQGTSEQAFTVSVLPAGGAGAPVIVHSANPVAAVGVSYLFDDDGAAAAGGTAPITWEVAEGPAGFSVDAATGLITWVPATAGSVTIELVAENAVGSDSYAFAVEVSTEAGLPPTAVARIEPLSGDAPLTVRADASESFAPPGKEIAFRRWQFGDGSPPVNEEVVEHTYQRPGSYVARLTVADALGAAGETSAVVSVAANGVRPPQARILVSSLEGSDALTVSFSCDCAAGDGPIEAYLWDFGDGARSDLPAVTHEFGPGGFEVRLTVVDANGLTAADAVAVTVSEGANRPPLVMASAQPVFGPAPLATSFLATFGDVDGEVTAVAWDFGDGGTASEVAPGYTFAVPGTYVAKVTVTDDLGLSSSATVEIDVSDAAGAYPPQILSLPRTDAAAGVPWVYDDDELPAARGDRPLAWSLGKNVGGTVVGAPEGMTVDGATGRLAWTPSAAQIGRVPVSLVAENAAAAVVQDFEVDVSGEPEPVAPPEGCGCRTATTGPGAALGAALLLLFARWRRRSVR